MKITKLSSGSTFEAVAGYSRAIVVEQNGYAEAFVSGCTGFDYSTMSISDDPIAQARQCFVNIAAALAPAGGDLSHLVRVRYYIPDVADWEIMAPIFGEFLGEAKVHLLAAYVYGLSKHEKVEAPAAAEAAK